MSGPFPKYARTKFPYTAADVDEITLAAGADVVVLEQHPNGWTLLDFNGKMGLFPDSYLEILPEPPKKQKAPPPPAPQLAPSPTPSPVASPPLPASAPPAGVSKETKAERRRSMAPNKAQQRKIIESISADLTRIQKLQLISEDIDTISKKETSDLIKLAQKCASEAEALREHVVKLASEMQKVGDKYKESAHAQSISKIGAALQVEDAARAAWVKSLQDATASIKQIEGEVKAWGGVEKRMKETNKKLDAHIKKQAEGLTKIPEENVFETAEVMKDISLLTKEVDAKRDEMIQHAEHYKNCVLHTLCSAFVPILASDPCTRHLDLSVYRRDPPKEPANAWESYEPRIVLPNTTSNNSGSSSAYPAPIPANGSIPPAYQPPPAQQAAPANQPPRIVGALPPYTPTNTPPAASTTTTTPSPSFTPAVRTVSSDGSSNPEGRGRRGVSIAAPRPMFSHPPPATATPTTEPVQVSPMPATTALPSTSAQAVQSPAPSAPSPWELYYTDDNYPYWYNSQTGESVWEDPN